MSTLDVVAIAALSSAIVSAAILYTLARYLETASRRRVQR